MEIKVDLSWSDEAKRDILELADHYGTIKAFEYAEAIEKQALDICYYPEIGTKWKRGDYKLLISGTPFFIIYELCPSPKNPKIAYVVMVIDGRNFPLAKEYQHLL